MEEYEELGMTRNESRVYEALVKFGKLGAGEISRESGVSYSKIYVVLDSLINKGLVNVVPEKSKKFSPANPEALIKLIEIKERKLQEAKEKAKTLKTFYDVKDKHPVIMGIGRKEFYRVLKEMKNPVKYDYSVKWSSEYRDDWVGDVQRRMKEGADIKNLVRYDKESRGNVDRWMKIHKNNRMMKNEGVAMAIRESEVLISLIKSNVTLLIRDAAFAKIAKRLFLAEYERAGEIGQPKN